MRKEQLQLLKFPNLTLNYPPVIIINNFFVRIMIKWLYLFFCKVGIHRYEKIDINYSFGSGGSTETIKCKDCGIQKIRRKNWNQLSKKTAVKLTWKWFSFIHEIFSKNIIFNINSLLIINSRSKLSTKKILLRKPGQKLV